MKCDSLEALQVVVASSNFFCIQYTFLLVALFKCPQSFLPAPQKFDKGLETMWCTPGCEDTRGWIKNVGHPFFLQSTFFEK